MSAKKVLVSGGAGFIGSHIVDAYVAGGWNVTVVDDLSTGTPSNLNPEAAFVEGDIASPLVKDLLRSGNFDLLNHQAAQVDVRMSVSDPARDAQINVVGALSLFQAALEGDVAKIVFASSGGAAYGEPEVYPQTEDHPTRPISPYGCAKLAAEHYLFYYHAIHQLPSVALRYANVYGPRQRKDGEAGVIAIFTGRLLDGEPVIINGTGDQTRDYVFVADVVRANMAASELPLQGAFNVGTGVETSVNELHSMIQEATGNNQPAGHAPGKTGEQFRSVLDGSRLRKTAGLPEPVTLAAGLRETAHWFRSQPGRNGRSGAGR